MGDPLHISQSLIGWGLKKITLLLPLKALFSQDSITQLLLKLALEVQFSQGSVIQSLLNSQDLKAKREQNERTNFLPRGANDTLIVDQDSNEIRSSIPSRMKRRTIWEVNTREALTVKRRTMVTTNQEVEDHVKDASPIFEEGIQATVDELKEINTDTTEDVLRTDPINGKFLKHYYA